MQNLMPPVVPEPLATVGLTLANRRWVGGPPIVPSRDEGLPLGERWTQYYGPNTVRRLSGGILSGQRLGQAVPPWRVFQVQHPPNVSVDDFYQNAHNLQAERLSAQRSGQPFDQEPAYQRMQRLSHFMGQMRAGIRGMDPEQRDRYERFAIGLARFANGQPSLSDYPNPLSSESGTSLGQDRIFPAQAGHSTMRTLGEVSRDVTLTLGREATAPRPQRQPTQTFADYQLHLQRWQQQRETAQRLLQELQQPERRMPSRR